MSAWPTGSSTNAISRSAMSSASRTRSASSSSVCTTSASRIRRIGSPASSQPRAASTMRIAIAGEAPCALAPIRQAIRHAARPYGLPRDAEVHVAFVSDTEMRALNKRFRRTDKTTDVLSFGETIPARDRGAGAIAHINGRRGENGGRFDLGEILISPQQAEKQARGRRKPVVEEVAFLAAHGVLHLLGYEDETPAGYQEMLRLGQHAARQKSVKR